LGILNNLYNCQRQCKLIIELLCFSLCFPLKKLQYIVHVAGLFQMSVSPAFELPEFERYVQSITACTPKSMHPRYVSAAVAKYLLHTKPDDLNYPWSKFYSVNSVDEWLNKQASRGYKAHTLYNILMYIRYGSDYCKSHMGMVAPCGFDNHLRLLGKILSRRRRLWTQEKLEIEGLKGVHDLCPLIAILKQSSIMSKFAQIYDKCSVIIEHQSQIERLSISDYLFAMRLCMSYVLVSSASRASAIYNLTLKQVISSTGDWSDSSPVVCRVSLHKTSKYRGYARIVLSGIGKSMMCMFIGIIRKAFLASNGLPESECTFVDSNGKQLSSSDVSKHLLAFFKRPYTPTYIRKCICTQIKYCNRRQAVVRDRLVRSITLETLQNLASSEGYKRVVSRDSVACTFHKIIINLYDI